METVSVTSQWNLALEQSRELEVTHGSALAVAEAVERGADLRLFLIAQGYEETLYFQQTYSGEGDAFAGMMTRHHSYAHRGTLAEQPYFSLFKYDTSGSFSQMKWMLSRRDQPGTSRSKRPTQAGKGTMLYLPFTPCSAHHSPNLRTKESGISAGQSFQLRW